ncbi:MAG: Hsp70 family protein [Acidimicrobiales bacterium]
MSDWFLGIDFGTSFTVAASARDGNVTVVDIESNGNARIPSSVFLTPDGEILVGSAAQHQAVFNPERYEPTPKRALGQGELFLGDRLVPVTDLVAAVLRRVYAEASRQQGERAPTGLRLTHPAEWGDVRLATLREASEKAALPAVEFVSEPVAAAARIAGEVIETGRHIAVYDFGGGTFDAAVLLKTPTGFAVAGRPAGRDPLGGEDIDESIMDYLGQILAADDAETWDALRTPRDASQRRDAVAFRAEVRKAKEILSEVTACQLWVPRFEREVQLTRTELNTLISASIEATVDTLGVAIADAGVAVADLAGTYLVGGSSRIPLVADMLWRRLGIRPSVQENPKSVVAMGAAGRTVGVVGSGDAARAAGAAAVNVLTGPTVAAGPTPSPVPGGASGPTSLIALSMEPALSPMGADCSGQHVIDRVGGPALTVRIREKPADVSLEETARRAGEGRAARSPGYREESVAAATILGQPGIERRFSIAVAGTAVPMLEQYVVVAGRAVVIASPVEAYDVVMSIRTRSVAALGPTWFVSVLDCPDPSGWSVWEQLSLRRRGSGFQPVITSYSFPGGTDLMTWRRDQLGHVLGFPGARLVGEVEATVVEGIGGAILTVQWRDGDTPMLTKLGLAMVEGRAISAMISVPHAQQSLFPSLAGHVRMVSRDSL